MNAELASFFEVMVPYYQARMPLTDVVQRLGPSPSGDSRFDFYRRLMAANRRRILRHVFPALHGLWTDPSRGGLEAPPMTWDQLADRFVDAHPVGHWDPNELGRALPGWLEGQGICPGLVECARWSWRLLAAARAEDAWERRLHRSVTADHHPFDVASWLAALERGPTRVPGSGPGLVLVVYRDRGAGVPRVLRPTLFELAALARAAGEAADELVSSLDTNGAALEAAEARLVSFGLVAEVAA